MPQSLAQLYMHLIFSTKDRARVLTQEIEEPLRAYFGGTLNNLHKRQKALHRKATFQEGFRRFLVKYGIPYDESYVWD